MQILLSSVSFGYMIQTCPARPPHPPSLAGRGSQSIFTQIVQIYATCSIKTLQFVIIHFCCLYGCENHADSPSLPAGWWCCPGVGVAIPPTHPPSPPTTLIFSTNQTSSLLPISHNFHTILWLHGTPTSFPCCMDLGKCTLSLGECTSCLSTNSHRLHHAGGWGGTVVETATCDPKMAHLNLQ